MVRAAAVGEKDIDKATRTVNVKHPKLLSIPKVGDIIIGTVAAVMSSMIAVLKYSLFYIRTYSFMYMLRLRLLYIYNLAVNRNKKQLK